MISILFDHIEDVAIAMGYASMKECQKDHGDVENALMVVWNAEIGNDCEPNGFCMIQTFNEEGSHAGTAEFTKAVTVGDIEIVCSALNVAKGGSSIWTKDWYKNHWQTLIIALVINLAFRINRK